MIQDNRERFAPGKLWSLWDIMMYLNAGFAADLIAKATMATGWANQHSRPKSDKDTPNVELLWKVMSEVFEGLESSPEATLWAPESIAMAGRLRAEFSVNLDFARVSFGLGGLIELLTSELSKRTFMYIAAPDHMASVTPFGSAVAEAFPGANMDIGEGSKCYACERYNAAVYHATCASEFGLKALARDRRIRFVKKNTPVDEANWGEILIALEKSLVDIRAWPKGAAKSAAEEFYEPAILEASKINSGWRIHISHGRGRVFERDEAHAVLGHASRFLARLSTRIGEKTRPTPIVWKSPSVGLSRKLRG